MTTVIAMIMTALMTLTNNYYTRPMLVDSNTAEECRLIDIYGNEWLMDYEEQLTEGMMINVLMCNNNTTNTYIDDIIITYTIQ